MEKKHLNKISSLLKKSEIKNLLESKNKIKEELVNIFVPTTPDAPTKARETPLFMLIL